MDNRTPYKPGKTIKEVIISIFNPMLPESANIENTPHSIDQFAGLFADVIIPLAVPKTYTWAVPAHLADILKPGCRVEVNLGKNKKYAGVVKRIHNKIPDTFEPKDILNILDAEPVVFEQQLKLWEWMASYYMCSEGEVMAAALPAHFKLSSETILVYNEEYGDDFSALDHDEYVVGEALLIKKELKLSEVQELIDSPHAYPIINRLIQKKVCHVWESLRQTYTSKKETYVLLNPQYDNEDVLAALLNEDKKLQRAEKQMELLLSYLHLIKTQGEVTRPELLKKAGATDAQLKGLVDKKILWTEKRNIDRLHYLPKDIRVDFQLSPAQETALTSLRESMQAKQVSLLHGITSSGKTNIYIKIIEGYVRRGQQVLYMLPEIALTSQVIRRLQKHFGGYIGIYHSKFSQNERIEIWNKVKSGELKIVVGARSSVFLPYSNLALIICDEEHDSSFKQQDPAPRYHGRDAAIYLAGLFSSAVDNIPAKVILGSATPSLESYYNAVTGKYGLVELMERFGDVRLPDVAIIDTKKIDKYDRQKVMLSPPLVKAVEETVARNRQVILFQNRRGYTPYQICKVCGWVPQCRYCDVSLTFHKFSNKLVCHYCGSAYPPVTTCAACGSHNFAERNFGTEKIEEMLQETFPSARIARMDIDTVKGKNAHDILIQQFEQQRIDVLVGTQMVVKGLDFDHVDLVGILDADGLLHFADFRVNERGFQLMEQVSGRSGRKPGGGKQEAGKVLIQTSQPSHPVLLHVQQHDYRKMFNEELEKRKQFFYPPFSRVINLSFRHKFKEVVENAAQQFANALQNKYGKYIVGPAEPIVARIRNQYLMELLLKLPKDKSLLQQCKKDLMLQEAILHGDKRFRSVVVIADVDVI